MKMTYKPNFNDPRVIKRCRRALGFLLSQMKENKPRELSRNYLNKIFGKSCNSLTDYLRETCLKVTNKHYSFLSTASVKRPGRVDTGKCKEYKRKEEGINELLNVCGLVSHELNTTQKRQILNSDLIVINPYCITSFETSTEHLKFALAMESATYEFGSMLKSKKIPYKDKSGRLFGGTQNLNKTVKRQLHLENNYCYEYDIDACAPTLLLQYAKKQGFKPTDDNMIEAYLKNKSAVRAQISESTGIEEKLVKKAINALFAGARVDRSIATDIEDPEQLRKFSKDPYVFGFKRDIAKMWKAIKPSIGVRYKKDNSVEKKISSKTKWSIYFKLERQVLDVVIQYLSDTNNDCVLEHDGWTSARRVNTEELINLIKERTTYEIKLSEEELKDINLIPWCAK